MIILEYALPIIAALLLVLFFAGLPNLKSCRLPAFPRCGPGREPVPERQRLTRADALILLALTLPSALLAFWGLGDRSAPERFQAMAGETALIELRADAAPSRVMLYTGVGSGSYEIEYSADGVNFFKALDFEQGHAEVLKWHALTPESALRPRWVRLRCTSGSPYLGEIAFLDGDGNRIPIHSDLPALCDEQEKTPAAPSYMNSSYFDEIYHARTAWEHLNNIAPYEISHPPLGKLILSLGICLFGMNPFGWRFMGTLLGVLMLPLMYLLLKKIFGGRAVPTLGTLVFASDFMRFVQTRIATIDTYAVFFILLMYLCMYLYLSRGSLKALALCGVFFGLGAASKWTCIYAGAGLALLWAARWVHAFRSASHPSPEDGAAGKRPWGPFLKNALFCLLFFVFIPCLIYYLSYLPYARAQGAPLFSRESLRIVLDNQAFMFHYHANIVSEHPYSSRWYQWILDIRPILYYLEYFDDGSRSSICAFLNPALCWGGFLSLFVLGYTALFRRDKIAGFLLVGYLAQLVPWMFIRRLTFEYHYFPSSVFLVLALAYVFRLFQLNRKDWLRWAVPFAAVSLALFALFYPALSGLPVNNAQASAFLGWLPTWPL